ncbi:MAG: 23S rRNA (adenine(2503)-C(2))-methyltransferase RlmN [Chloroflexi bacterium]|nr:23S rRNA (adenine(2503)-C(2))-methyltransferase RlmN [Chloroflexota bacterium]
MALADLSLDELSALFKAWGEPQFHAVQVWRWLHLSSVTSFDEMSDLPARIRQELAENSVLNSLLPVHVQSSVDRETEKVLFRLRDGKNIEAVSMRQPRRRGGRHTVCVSTQAGCPVGCAFCATGQQGFRRNLSAGEIVEQVLFFARKSPESPVSNVVFMGMGEPLLNYEATVKAIRILNAPQGRNLGARHITVSTAGVVPGIKRLSGEGMQVGLAISLHAPNDSLRQSLVPLGRKYPLRALIAAARDYFASTGRRVSFEYTLFNGINDSVSLAAQLARLLAGMNCHVNLIPANRNADSTFRAPSRDRVAAFRDELIRRGVTTTLRRSLGGDIQAGCGQLAAYDTLLKPCTSGNR